nr:unnamed protein product [Spirometra erinaceieuropaei]
MSNTASTLLLRKQLAELNKSGPEGFSAGLIDDDNIFKWQVMIMGPADTLYDGGCFKAILEFPQDYPNRPPKMQFVTDMWHPNIAPSGNIVGATKDLKNGGFQCTLLRLS